MIIREMKALFSAILTLLVLSAVSARTSRPVIGIFT